MMAIADICGNTVLYLDNVFIFREIVSSNTETIEQFLPMLYQS